MQSSSLTVTLSSKSKPLNEEIKFLFPSKNEKAENPYGTIVGKTSFFRAISELEKIEFEGDSNLEKAITNCPNTSSGDGLTVIISDFFTKSDWKKAVDYLVYKKRQVLLVQIMTPDEIEEPTEQRYIDAIRYETDIVTSTGTADYCQEFTLFNI